MKKIITAMTLLAGVVSVYPQGTVFMNDYNAANSGFEIQIFPPQTLTNSPVQVTVNGYTGYEEMGQPANSYLAHPGTSVYVTGRSTIGSGYSVGLLALDGGGAASYSQLSFVSSSTASTWFNSLAETTNNPAVNNNYGIWNSSASATVPGSATNASVAVAVWQNTGSSGAATTLAQAQADGYQWGVSSIQTASLATGIAIPGYLPDTITSFSLAVTPLTVTTVASPGSEGTVSPSQTNFSGDVVTVIATNDPGFGFVNWTSNNVVVSTTTNYSFTLTANVTLTANFAPFFDYTVAASPGGDGTVSPGETNVLGDTFITVVATNNPGFDFVSWTSNSVTVATTTNYTFLLNTNVAMVANFLPTYVVTVTTSGGGTASPSSTNISGTSVTVIATNAPGYAFADWTSNAVVVSATPNYTFTITTNLTLTANFTLAPASIAVYDHGTALTNNQTNAVGFPAIQIGQTGPIVSFVVSNLGGLPLTVSNISVPTNFVLTTNAPATLTNLPTDIPGLTNSPATNGVFGVQLVASSVGTYSGTVVVTNSDTNFTFPITATVSPAAPVMSVLSGANALTNGQTNAFAFGSVPLLTPGGLVQTFTITNPGLLALSVSNITVPAGYTVVTNAPTNIPAGGSGSFSVELESSNAGTFSGNISIANNDTNNNPFVFPVTGTVTVSIIALSGNLNFGVVTVGASSNLTLTISNLGNTNLTVSNIMYPPGFSGAFAGVVGPSNSQAVPVTFAPSAASNYGGLVTVHSDAMSGTSTLAGSGFGGGSNLFLTVITNGAGTVGPILTAKALVAGRKYTLTATPKSGNIFSNWSGSTNSSRNVLTFVMEPGTVLEASFIANPFTPIKGAYNGLFSASNGINELTAGMLKNFVVGPKGTYSGTLMLNGAGHGVSGTFTAGGEATNVIKRSVAQGGNLTVVLTLVTATGATPALSGVITASNWVSTNLVADLASNLGFSSAYTMVIPPDTNQSSSNGLPVGDGYAVITNHVGSIKITGALADGTAFSQSVPASGAEDVPVYASLYGNKGLLLGWINLSSSNGPGTLYWVHPTQKTGQFTASFTSTNPIALSGWTNPPARGNLPTNLTILESVGGAITQTDTFVIAISNNFKLGEISGPLPLSGSINPKTGQITVALGSKENKFTANGVILANGANGGGAFVTHTNSGALLLTP